MPDALFRHAGALVDDYAAVDWSATALGSPAAWSTTLRNTVALMLRTRFPVTLIWGPEHVLVYNEAYVELIGDKHPAALGSRCEEMFDEAWPVIGPLVDGVMTHGEAFFLEDAAVPLHRHGFLEECYFTYAYSPVTNAAGEVEGLMDIATETTRSVIAQRRISLLARLGDVLADATEPGVVLTEALRLLREAHDDVAAVDLRPASGDPDPRVPASPGTPLAHRDLLVEERAGTRVCWLALTPGAEFGAALRLPPEEERPALAVVPSPMLPMDDEHESFLRLLAATIGAALDRVDAISRERRTAAAERALSTTLQRSLLSEPIRTERVEVVVRYQPALDIAQVGGDWHDSFLLTEGTLALAVGDVAGHDSQAAAAMAQIRNLLRGIAIAAPGSPAGVLGALDRALDGLGVVEVATSVYAGVQSLPEGHRLRWSNAGHPPPVLLGPDGDVRLLETEPDPLLGLVPEIERTDHEELLSDDSLLVFFTDGLVERRDTGLGAGLEWLVGWIAAWAAENRVRRLGDDDPDRLADALLAAVEPHAEDDIALVVVRTRAPA
ncbi:SpoIIE family protein phosphatase [Nocardioides fonticola]|uniref:SpoIIE family protein phosphatase n=1 Tax=Nocardioides fonticola TaxID=450363 RepID=A0ABP7XSE4_9ACTN